MKLLRFLRIVDEDDRLSLTHLSLFVALFCIVRGIQVSLSELGVMATALGAYQYKRTLQANAAGQASDSAVGSLKQTQALHATAIQQLTANMKNMAQGLVSRGVKLAPVARPDVPTVDNT